MSLVRHRVAFDTFLLGLQVEVHAPDVVRLFLVGTGGDEVDILAISGPYGTHIRLGVVGQLGQLRTICADDEDVRILGLRDAGRGVADHQQPLSVERQGLVKLRLASERTMLSCPFT